MAGPTSTSTAAASSSKGESKYERLRKIGIGSYGVVFKCVNRLTGQVVAIKRYSEDDSDPVIRKIAMREVRTLRQLKHPNLIHLIEVFRRRRRLHLVFDYCELTVLDVIEKYGNSCPVNLIKKIVWQIVNGINYCHSNQCIHRDVKPENILINQAGVVKLCDFGFARRISNSASSTSSHQYSGGGGGGGSSSQAIKKRLIEQSQDVEVAGLKQERQALTDYVATRWYRAPELLIGEIYYDTKIDIWAIGCVTAELMRGKPVWPGKSDLDQLFMIINSLGALTSDQQRTLLGQALYDQVHLDKLSQLQNSGSTSSGQGLDLLDRKLPTRMGSAGFNFVSACLQMEPKNRPTSEQLLLHSFIHSARMAQFMAEASPHEAANVSALDGGLQHRTSITQVAPHRSNSQSLLMLANQQPGGRNAALAPEGEAADERETHSHQNHSTVNREKLAPASKSRLPVLSSRSKPHASSSHHNVPGLQDKSRQKNHHLPLSDITNRRLEPSTKRSARSTHPTTSVKFGQINSVSYLPSIVTSSPRTTKLHAHQITAHHSSRPSSRLPGLSNKPLS